MRPKDPKKINKMGLQTYVDSLWGLKDVTSSKSNKIITILYGRIWLVVGSLPCLERFFSRYSSFPLSSKTNIFSNSNSIWNTRTGFNEFLRTSKSFEGKKKIHFFEDLLEHFQCLLSRRQTFVDQMLIKFLIMKIINVVWKAVHGMDATLSQQCQDINANYRTGKNYSFCFARAFV